MQTMERRGRGTAPIHPPRRPAPWPVEFYRSAVGKKWVMALTGVALIGFVFAHMVGNFHLFEGAEGINHYGEALRDVFTPIFPRTMVLWLMRIGLIVAFALHIHSAYSLTRMNQRSRAGGYQQSRDWQAANIASRSMRLTGVIILLFLIFHLADLTWGWANADYVRGDIYRNLMVSQGNVVVALLYVIAVVALGVHLYHGTWSMFQSLGLNNPKWNLWRRRFATGLAVVITVGYLATPFAVQAGIVDDDECEKQGSVLISCEPQDEGTDHE